MPSYTLSEYIRPESVAALYANSARVLRGRDLPDGIRFLCYHSVTKTHVSPEMEHTVTITETEFLQQLQLLKALNFDVISMHDALALLQRKASLNKAYACITFDDGYLDNWEVAWPLLQRYRYPAHFFITTRCIGKRQTIQKNNSNIDVKYMNDQMLKSILREGGSIGSHTVTHADLTRLQSHQIRRELVDSKAQLEDHFGAPIDTFAYPYSDYSTNTMHHVRSAGYSHAFSLEYRAIYPTRLRSPFAISRSAVMSHEPLNRFRLKLLGGYDCTFFYTLSKRTLTRTLRSFKSS